MGRRTRGGYACAAGLKALPHQTAIPRTPYRLLPAGSDEQVVAMAVTIYRFNPAKIKKHTASPVYRDINVDARDVSR